MKLPADAPSWLESGLLLLTRSGSQAYGTALPTSDLDLRGVAVGTRSHYLGLAPPFEQYTAAEPDLVVFELRKFMRLAAEANPSVLELLFTEPIDRLVVSPLGARLLAAREAFLSKRVRASFVGYATSQLKRIQTHRAWLLHPPAREPQRSDYGLPEHTGLPREQRGAIEALVRTQLDGLEVDWGLVAEPERLALRAEWERVLVAFGCATAERREVAEAALGFDANFIDLLQRERAYRAAKQQWEQYACWRRERNPARAALEAAHGYDAKHAMHLVRLLRMGHEILSEGELRVRRPDAAELLAIRGGAWSYEQLMAWMEAQHERIEQAYRHSTLPAQPNGARLDALCCEIVAEVLSLQRDSCSATEGLTA